ncbi:hypothetical protein, partial [Ruthenibacterium lactatiformans]|uniref:hypothetical protein n=1 Tax=Ruthenibacterium lactatiformans TaxID=1550024 RepID=UPI0026DD2194
MNIFLECPISYRFFSPKTLDLEGTEKGVLFTNETEACFRNWIKNGFHVRNGMSKNADRALAE